MSVSVLSTKLSLAEVTTPGPFRGSPFTLGLLCVVVAAAGAAVGAVFGSSAEQRIDEQRRVYSLSTQGELLRSRRTEEAKHQLEKDKYAAELEQLDRTGVLQEARDMAAAEKLGLPLALEKDLARMSGDDARRVLAALVREGRRNGLDPFFIAAVIHVETHFDPYATSGVGARGLMQLMPATAIDLAHKRGYRLDPKQLFNPVVNIELGAMYLKYLVDRFGDARSALIAYNAGPTIARHAHLSAGVRAYPRNVLAQYERLTWLASKGTSANPMATATASR